MELKVLGECYLCNKAIRFWLDIVNEKEAYHTYHKAVKLHEGQRHNSLYFSFEKEV